MVTKFSKYHGTGNDFILIDNRNGLTSLNQEIIAKMCHRRFGIGADGLMLLENAPEFDFKMVYYNADGLESTMCGNGGRCMVSFAHSLGLLDKTAQFTAIDGEHAASILGDGQVCLKMTDVTEIKQFDDHCELNTGSPHYVTWYTDVDSIDVVGLGRAIRNRPEYSPKGINVNFAELNNGGIRVRTYERGVEDETYSCGTGVTAVAIVASGGQTGQFNYELSTPGGMLKVAFTKESAYSATNVTLTGPAVFVFDGTYQL